MRVFKCPQVPAAGSNDHFILRFSKSFFTAETLLGKRRARVRIVSEIKASLRIPLEHTFSLSELVLFACQLTSLILDAFSKMSRGGTESLSLRRHSAGDVRQDCWSRTL